MIRTKLTKDGRKRYAARVYLGAGKYKLLETRATRAAARKDEAAWLLKRQGAQMRSCQEHADQYLRRYRDRVKLSTYTTGESAITVWLRTFGSRSLASIDDDEAQQWASENRWAVPPVVTMLNAAVPKLIDANPFKGLSRKGSRKHNDPLTVADVDRLAAIADQEHGVGPFVLFTAYTGLRVGEVFALQWSDIDFKANRVLVRRRLYGSDLDLPKSNRVRKVVLAPPARDALLGLDRDSEWVFLAKRGGRMSQSILTYYWQKIEAGFGRPVTPHELKHFAGHFLYVTMGLPARVVGVQLGHAGPSLVEDLYGHGDVGALEEIDRAFEGNVVPLRKASGE